MRSTRPTWELTLCLRSVAILATVLACVVEAAPAISDTVEAPGMGAPRNPEVWGARLPGRTDRAIFFGDASVSPSGDILIDYQIDRDESKAYPYSKTSYYYGFFSGRLLHSVEVGDRDSATKDDPAEPQGSVDAPSGFDGKPLEGLRRLSRLLNYRLFPRENTREWPRQELPGSLEHPRLFPVGLVSPLDHNYVRRDPSGRVMGDKVFVEVFDEPTTVLSRHHWPVASRGQFDGRRAIALELAFYGIPDGTLLGIDYARLIAIRLTDWLESPFFDQDRNLMALEGAQVRAWIEEGFAKLPGRSHEPTQDDVDAVDRYLEDKIVAAWRARR